MDNITLGAAIAMSNANKTPDIDVKWTKGQMIGSAGITNSVSMAISNLIPCSGGDILLSDTPYTDSNNVWLVYYIGEYNETGFLRRREVSKAGSSDKWPVTLSQDVTYVYVSFGGYGSRGTITDADIETYADLRIARAPVNVSVFHRMMSQVNSKLEHSEARREIKMAMFGDSITQGSLGGSPSTFTEYNIPYWIETLLGVETVNYGVGGQGWLCQISDKTGLDKVKESDLTDIDVVTLAYGINDSSYTLGTYLDTDQDETVMGQMYSAISWLAANHPDIRIIIVGPTNTANKGSAPRWRMDATLTGGYTGQQMVDEYRKFANRYGLPFIDMSVGAISYLALPDMLADNLHPSEAGYKLLGRYMAAQLGNFI